MKKIKQIKEVNLKIVNSQKYKNLTLKLIIQRVSELNQGRVYR